MKADQTLTLAFLERQPGAAAAVLQELDAGDAAAFLTEAPARIAGPVLERMAPWAAAACMERLEAEKAAALVQSMSTQGGAGVLRLLPDTLREEVLELLPRSAARAVGASLSYPRDTVGSWMDHKVPSFSDATAVGEALRFLRTRRRKPPPALFVTGANREFVGVVDLGDLLKAADTATLSAIVDGTVTPLSNRARLSSVAAAPEWDRFNVLPVVGRRRNFLGALSRERLRAGIAEGAPVARQGEALPLLAHLASAYLLTCLGTVQAIADTVLAETPLSRQEKETSHGR